MKLSENPILRIVPFVRVIILSTLFFTQVSCKKNDNILHGYVEGEYVYISSEVPGILKDLHAIKGAKVSKTQTLFNLDDKTLKSGVLIAEAEVLSANITINDLINGAKNEETEIIKKQLEQSFIELKNIEKEYDRAKRLLTSKFISSSEYDDAETNYKKAFAGVEILQAELRANLKSIKMEKRMADTVLEKSKQNLLQAKKKLNDSAPKSTWDGFVEDIFFSTGEFVPAGYPVFSILPAENIKVRFFVSQKMLPSISYGKQVNVNCDGCKKSVPATIKFISRVAEYTPPMIYSTDSREKFVYLVEAYPESYDAKLKPGLPVDIVSEDK